MNPPKRYQVFGGDNHYEPQGGMRDLLASFDQSMEALAYASGYVAGSGCTSWARVYDAEEQREMKQIYGSPTA